MYLVTFKSMINDHEPHLPALVLVTFWPDAMHSSASSRVLVSTVDAIFRTVAYYLLVNTSAVSAVISVFGTRVTQACRSVLVASIPTVYVTVAEILQRNTFRRCDTLELTRAASVDDIATDLVATVCAILNTVATEFSLDTSSVSATEHGDRTPGTKLTEWYHIRKNERNLWHWGACSYTTCRQSFVVSSETSWQSGTPLHTWLRRISDPSTHTNDGPSGVSSTP